jgi:2-polyprenyl-3-methyl-5-hydroxy-6-metoxy-1,4-benzoquinol methylase
MAIDVSHSQVQEFYDTVYYRTPAVERPVSWHLHRLAQRFEPWHGKRTLDVGCGMGMWLRAVSDRGATVAGIDLSRVAVEICRKALPAAEVHCAPAEELPFADQQFDFVSCLGALEHFINPKMALAEMVRVAKPSAKFLLLVPNADFLPARLRIYPGTNQAGIREEPRSLQEWQQLFESAGLEVLNRWRDLHVLSPDWVMLGRWYLRPLRLAQALMLPLWPLRWQYQVYYHCRLPK